MSHLVISVHEFLPYRVQKYWLLTVHVPFYIVPWDEILATQNTCVVLGSFSRGIPSHTEHWNMYCSQIDPYCVSLHGSKRWNPFHTEHYIMDSLQVSFHVFSGNYSRTKIPRSNDDWFCFALRTKNVTLIIFLFHRQLFLFYIHPGPFLFMRNWLVSSRHCVASVGLKTELSLINWFDDLSSFSQRFYGAAKPQWFGMVPPFINRLCCTG